MQGILHIRREFVSYKNIPLSQDLADFLPTHDRHICRNITLNRTRKNLNYHHANIKRHPELLCSRPNKRQHNNFFFTQQDTRDRILPEIVRRSVTVEVNLFSKVSPSSGSPPGGGDSDGGLSRTSFSASTSPVTLTSISGFSSKAGADESLALVTDSNSAPETDDTMHRTVQANTFAMTIADLIAKSDLQKLKGGNIVIHCATFWGKSFENCLHTSTCVRAKEHIITCLLRGSSIKRTHTSTGLLRIGEA